MYAGSEKRFLLVVAVIFKSRTKVCRSLRHGAETLR
jgi:hypothetical protein